VMKLRLTLDVVDLPRRSPLVFVARNASQLESFGIPAGECLDRDQLAVCITRQLRPAALWRLAARAMLQGLHGAPELDVVCARELQVHMRPKRVRVALDGEVIILETPLRYRLRAAAFQVLVGAAGALHE
jgi:diacylglycerol kinase family enzyme